MFGAPLLWIHNIDAICKIFRMYYTFQLYDPSTNTWEPSVELTGFRLGFCTALSQDQRQLYIMGGIDQDARKKRLESLDLETLEWTKLADMSHNRTFSGCSVYGSGLVVGGGWGEFIN